MTDGGKDLKSLPTRAREYAGFAFSGRFRVLAELLILFAAFNALVRLGLTAFNGDASLLLPWKLLPAMAIGLLFDVAVATCVLAPLALLIAVLPGRGKWPSAVMSIVLLPLSVTMVFVGLAEFTFWNEFASRFNFVAVDYLIYTNEVIGNLRESYNLPLLLSAVGAVSLALWALAIWRVHPLLMRPARPWHATLVAVALWCAAPAVAITLAEARYKEFSDNSQLNELAGNGYFDFWHAFRFNEIDYDRY